MMKTQHNETADGINPIKQAGALTKEERRTAKWRYTLGKKAIEICGRFLGPIPRDQTALDALQAARVLAEGLYDEVAPMQKWIHDPLYELFDGVCEVAEDAVSPSIISATSAGEDYYIESFRQVRVRFCLAFELAWREL